MNADFIKHCLQQLYDEPMLLKQHRSDIYKKLKSQGRQGTENHVSKVTEHEAAMATFLESKGFHFLEKTATRDISSLVPNVDGYYYMYEPNGSQKAPDIRLLQVKDSKIQLSLDVDLKHSTNKIIKLNDGFFDKDIVYVITFKRNSKGNFLTAIALGQDIVTEKSIEKYKADRELKNKINKDENDVDGYCNYWRFAASFNCERFSDEWRKERLHSVFTWLASSASQVSFVPVQVKKATAKAPSKSSPQQSQAQEALRFLPEQSAPSDFHTTQSPQESPGSV